MVNMSSYEPCKKPLGQSSPGRENSRYKGPEGGMNIADGCHSKRGLWEQRDWGYFVRLCGPESKFGLSQMRVELIGKKDFGRKMMQNELCLEMALTAMWRMDSTG